MARVETLDDPNGPLYRKYTFQPKGVSRGKVVVVEDWDVNLSGLGKFFANEGFYTYGYLANEKRHANPFELRSFANSVIRDQPLVAIVDPGMGMMDGIAFCDHLYINGVYVVAFSGAPPPFHLDWANKFVEKPKFDKLADILNSFK